MILRLIIYIELFFLACAFSIAQVPINRIFKNLGSLINSSSDEFQPVIFQDTLYFHRDLSAEKSKNYEIYCIALKDIYCPSPDKSKLNPIKLIKLKSINSPNKIFSGTTPSFFKFFSNEVSDNNLDKSVAQTGLNSDYNDIQPNISADGQIIVFASDRAGNHDNTDLYVSTRNPDGSWTAPRVLSSGLNGINTSENEITPYIAPDGSLYYASKGFPIDNTEYYFSASELLSKRKAEIYKTNAKLNFNIVRAEPVAGAKGNWQNPKVLPAPYNTNWDDLGPAVKIDSITKETLIFLSSNRISDPAWGDAFGNFDLYGFCSEKCTSCLDSCVSNIVEGFIDVECPTVNDYKGRLKFYRFENETLKLEKEMFVPNNGKFSYKLPVPYNCRYVVEFIHPCTEEKITRQFYLPCEIDNLYNCPDCTRLTPQTKIINLDTFALGHPCCCKPVEIEVQMNCYSKKKKGMKYEIFDDEKLLASGNVDKAGKIKKTLDYSSLYKIKVYYKCNGDTSSTLIIRPVCNKTKKQKINANIDIPLECCCVTQSFDLDQYEIPFFITGYYFPTTSSNYHKLVEKFDGIFYDNPNVKYINIEDFKYETTSETVEKVLKEIVNSIKSNINEDECSCNLIEVYVEGFADPRLISENAQLVEHIPEDKEIEIMNDNIENFFSSYPKMTNNLLSVLRAYNTAKYLKEQVQNSIKEGSTQIEWKVEGKGIDISKRPSDLLRRIKVSVKCLK
ncbi:MAG: hypothetical protein NT007_17550 [Candidatus Kapabacteria bacterium]|nr:hypothetical protein [Candidatus Kapabacteria bacterium]